MAIDVTKSKSGKLLLECECGNIHTLSLNEETDEIEVSTKYVKKEKETPPVTPETPKKKKGLFS